MAEPVLGGMNAEKWGWELDVQDVRFVDLELQCAEQELQCVEQEPEMVQGLLGLVVEGHRCGTNGYQELEPVAGTGEWISVQCFKDKERHT